MSKDADKLIAVMYKEYLRRRKDGDSKAKAKHYGSSHSINKELIPKWKFEDVDDTCRELHRLGLVSVLYADNVCCEISLTDAGVTHMEHKLGKKIESVISYINQLAQLIP